MKVEYMFTTLLGTILLLTPYNLAESDTISFIFDVSSDIAANQNTPQLSDDTNIDKKNQHAFFQKQNPKEKIKAYSAVLLIKPVEIHSNWESEFSSIISDNLVYKDTSFIRKQNHGLKKMLRKSEILDKMVVIPMINSETFLKPIDRIIKSRNEFSLFPEEMSMIKLKEIPQIIKVTPKRTAWQEIKFAPGAKRNSKNATNLKLANNMKPTESSVEQFLSAPLFRKHDQTKPSQPTSRTTSKSILETFSKEESSIETDEVEFLPKIIESSQPEIKAQKLETKFDKLLDDIDAIGFELIDKSPLISADKKTTIDINVSKTLKKSMANANKDDALIDIYVYETMPKESGVDSIREDTLIDSNVYKTMSKESEVNPNLDLLIDNIYGAISKESEVNTNKDALIDSNAYKAMSKKSEINSKKEDPLIDSNIFKTIPKKSEVNSKEEHTLIDSNAYKKTPKKSEVNSNMFGIIPNIAFPHLLSPLNVKKFSKPKDVGLDKLSNYFKSFINPSLNDKLNKRQSFTSNDFNRMAQIQGFTTHKNIDKSRDSKIDSVLEMFPPSLRHNPPYFYHDVMRFENLPNVEEIPDKKEPEFFQAPFIFLKDKTFPEILGDEEAYNEIKEFRSR